MANSNCDHLHFAPLGPCVLAYPREWTGPKVHDQPPLHVFTANPQPGSLFTFAAVRNGASPMLVSLLLDLQGSPGDPPAESPDELRWEALPMGVGALRSTLNRELRWTASQGHLVAFCVTWSGHDVDRCRVFRLAELVANSGLTSLRSGQ